MPTFPPKLGTVSVDFTDGDKFKRRTVTDANVSPTSIVFLQVCRPHAVDADVDDPGWMYAANVVNVTAGAFDAVIAVWDWNDDQPVNNNGPTETISLSYLIT